MFKRRPRPKARDPKTPSKDDEGVDRPPKEQKISQSDLEAAEERMILWNPESFEMARNLMLDGFPVDEAIKVVEEASEVHELSRVGLTAAKHGAGSRSP